MATSKEYWEADLDLCEEATLRQIRTAKELEAARHIHILPAYITDVIGLENNGNI